MNPITDLIDEAKRKAAIPSDYALAKEIGVTKQTISAAKHGRTTFGAYTRQRLADLTGRNIDEINALIEIATETDEKKREYWLNFSKRFGGIAAGVSTLFFSTDLIAPAMELAQHCVLC